jgi:hypothetical protein
MSFSDHLDDYVEAAAAKYLSAVDALPDVSNQHEIGGLVRVGFKRYLGEPGRGDKSVFNARLVYVSDDEEAPTVCDDAVTWYGATRRDLDRALEYRLYYKSNSVTAMLNEGDFLLVAKLKDGSLLLVFTPAGGTVEAQLRSLFGLSDVGESFKAGTLDGRTLLLPLRLLLEDIGLVCWESGDEGGWLERLVGKFGEKTFPATKEFSCFARESADDVDPVADPDRALVGWMDHEEFLFRVFEKHLVAQRLRQGFGAEGGDVDEFIGYSLSVQNRRKSRVGHAFEGHLEAVFRANSLQFERGKKKDQVTENNSKPDFLFPDFASYHDCDFPSNRLFLLGAKTTCKDRWRQVIAEASRIKRKHLVTLEAAISESQTGQMEAHDVQLVVPAPIAMTYSVTQQRWVMNLGEFVELIRTHGLTVGSAR